MRVVAVLPTYNRRVLLKQAIDSVLNQTRKPDDFLILNNASNDGTAVDLKELLSKGISSPRLHVFHETLNLGASQGMCALFKKALELKPDWVWVMDDDACASPSALEEILKCPEIKDPETYILQSAIVDGKDQWIEANRPARFNRNSFEFNGLTASEFNEALKNRCGISVNTGGYCGLLIRREAFYEFGFPRSDFYLWYDDIEFVLRVSMQKKVYLVPQSRIQHFAQALVEHKVCWPFSGPLPQIPKGLLWRYYYLNRNWLWMAKQWMPKAQYLKFFIKHFLRNLLGPLFLRQTQIPTRMLFALRASVDALFNRLGPRIKNPHEN